MVLQRAEMMAPSNWRIVKEVEIPGRGRGLVAARHVGGGEVLVREAPLLIYMEAEAARSKAFCEQCVRSLPAAGGTSCASCSTALFCSSDCLAEAQGTSHTPVVCRALRKLVASKAEKDIENQAGDAFIKARFLIAAYNLTAQSPQTFEKLLELSGSAKADDEAGVAADNAEALHAFIQDAVEDGGLSVGKFSVDLIRALLVKDETNAFALMAPSKDGERRVRAYAFYSQASLLNHNCIPNSCRFDYLETADSGNRDVIVRALHEIEEGTEVCISYFPINWQYADRQRRLSEDYGFVCTCNRCEIEQQWADEEDEDGDEGRSSVEDEEDTEYMVAQLKLPEPEEERSVQGKEEEGSEGGEEEEEDDFPHALFFVKYLCPVAECGGTMAPLDPSSGAPRNGMECNMCGVFRADDALLADLREHGILV